MPYFREANHPAQYHNAFVFFLVSPKNPYIIEFVFSLLNFLASYQENGVLPYSGWLSYDPIYSKTALQYSEILMILLEPNIFFKEFQKNIPNIIELQEIANYYLDLQPEDSVKMRENQNHSNYYIQCCIEILSNYCITVVANIQDQNYLKRIAINLLKLIKGNSLDAQNTLFINSMKKIDFLEETLMIIWRIHTYNKYFINFLLEGQIGYDFLSTLLSILHEKFSLTFQSGSFNLALSFLSVLSLIREFATSLSVPLKSSFVFPNLPVISGNHVDFLIAVIHSGIMKCYEEKQFCPSLNFLSILFNLSYYTQNISLPTSIRLIQLLELFANYENIFDDATNVICFEKMLAIIDNIIVYQGEVEIYIYFRLFNFIEKCGFVRDYMEETAIFRSIRENEHHKKNDTISSAK